MDYITKVILSSLGKKSKKADFERVHNEVHEYLKSTNPHVAPTKGISSGTHGDDFEMQAKRAFGNLKFVGVASAKRPDTFKKVDGIKIIVEMKIGAGELYTLDREGNIISSLDKSDYIAYAPFYNPLEDVTTQSYMIPTDEFIPFMDSLKLIRKKQSTAMIRRVKNGIIPECESYNDKISIQTFSHWKSKKLELAEAIQGFDTMREWIDEHLK